jgi:hypothetical protein
MLTALPLALMIAIDCSIWLIDGPKIHVLKTGVKMKGG